MAGSAPASPRDARRSLSGHLSSPSLWRTLDRTQVLGDDDCYGHSGCVNAVSWSEDGQTLVSGGDDRTLCFWRPDEATGEMTLRSVIETGHTANIFSAQFLPHSTLIATCAGDREVRVFDVERARGDAGLRRASDGRAWEVSRQEPLLRVLRCHRSRVKRIIPESPDHFLSVSEDRTVRHHDLRTAHTCKQNCPQPLVQLPHQLSAIARSSLTPFYFVVAGSSPYGHLFDRRMIPRLLAHEWGVEAKDGAFAQCVRRFGRKSVPSYEKTNHAHVTGARMSESNGHELLLSYSGDAVHIYSIYDDCEDTSFASPESHILPPSPKRRRLSPKAEANEDTVMDDAGARSDYEADAMEALLEEAAAHGMEEEEEDEDEDEEEEEDEDEEEEDGHGTAEEGTKSALDKTGLVYSRMCYRGACNVETVKDVNFLGPGDEFVASGSDDGHWFLWNKRTARLEGVYEGDGSVVNVIEPHPFLPIVAVSGIDTTVKIFSPVPATEERKFSRMTTAEDIIRSNTERAESSANIPQVPLVDVLLQLYRARGVHGVVIEEGGQERDCVIM